MLYIKKKGGLKIVEELKTRSFRITEETSERIKELAVEIGGNQQEVMAKLIEAYEFQKGKAVLLDKKEYIEKFEQYSAVLTHMYMASLEDNQKLSATIHTEYESQLTSKDLVIQNLQEENKSLKQETTEAATHQKAIGEENQALQHELNEARREAAEKKNTHEHTIKDKEELNQALLVTVSELKSRIESMELAHQAANEIKKNYSSLETRLQETENNFQRTALETEKRILALDKAYQEEIQKIKSENMKEIDQYQKKYLELLEKMQEKEESKAPPTRKRATKKTESNPEE